MKKKVDVERNLRIIMCRVKFGVLLIGICVARICFGQLAPQDNWQRESSLTLSLSGQPQAICGDGINVYLAYAYIIQVRTRDLSTVITNMGTYGSSTGELSSVTAVACDENNLYVCDNGNARVKVFSKAGGYVTEWGLNDWNPVGLAVDADAVYVLNYTKRSVEIFQKDGTHVRSWGEYGTALGKLAAITGIAVGPEHVYISESTQHRVQVFTKNGLYVRSWEIWPSSYDFTPVDIAINAGNVYIVGSRLYGGPCADTGYYAIIYDKFGVNKFTHYLGYTGHEGTKEYPRPNAVGVSSPYFYVSTKPYTGYSVLACRQLFRTLGTVLEPGIAQADVYNVCQRSGTSILDFDYVIQNGTATNYTTYAAAFVGDSGTVPRLTNIIPIKSLVDETSTNLGSGVVCGIPKRISWDMAADGLTAVFPEYGQINVAVYCMNGASLLDLHFLHLPAVDSNLPLTINRAPLLEKDLLPLWFWFLASGDPEIRLSAGTVVAVGGAHDSEVYADDTGTRTLGREWLLAKMGLREAVPAELMFAREATTPGSVSGWAVRRTPPSSGSLVNEFNFVTSPTNGFWVVPL